MSSTPAVAVSSVELRDWLVRLAGPVGADPLEEVALLEQVKAACAARQARAAVAFDAAVRAREAAEGVPARRRGRGVAEQVALARRESPSRGSRHLGLAKALVREMPHALGALQAGLVSEWTATVLVRETACLAAEDRRRVDAELADRLPRLGPKRAAREAWAAACRVDPHSAVARHRKAVGDRHVSVRPAPDAMTYLTALLPVKDGVAAWAALDAAAGSARAAGDGRSRGQVMADTLVERLTRRSATGADPTGEGADVEVCVVITDAALLGSPGDEGFDEPATVTTSDGSLGDVVPAPMARDLVRDARTAFWRRLYADPAGQLVAMDSTRRLFVGQVRRLLVFRDQTCRTPWCEAPVRHADHVHDHADGGPTSVVNGQGQCERCSYTKNLPGWRTDVISTGRDAPFIGAADPPAPHTVRTTTPTGRTYDSTAPPLVRWRAG